MKMYLNALRYGDSKTKTILWAMILLPVIAVALFVSCFITNNYTSMILGFILLTVEFLITNQYDFRELKDMDLDIDDDKPIAPEDILIRYTEKRMRQVFIKFKVKPDHRPILIDRSEKYKIHQTPAYIWVLRGQVHILLIEKNARELVLPAASFRTVTYRRGVPVNYKGEYIALRKPSLLQQAFFDFLPTVYERGNGTIRKQYKNLYIIGEDIAVTNRSVSQVFDLLDSNFVMKDKITESGEYSEDFLDMYKAYTLFRDQVISAEEYKKRVTGILDNMAVSNMLDLELRINLDKMQKLHFITEEYVRYCFEKRVKMYNDSLGR